MNMDLVIAINAVNDGYNRKSPSKKINFDNFDFIGILMSMLIGTLLLYL